jgi:hypothetical protein
LGFSNYITEFPLEREKRRGEKGVSGKFGKGENKPPFYF